MNNSYIKEVSDCIKKSYYIEGNMIDIKPMGNGRINKTYLVITMFEDKKKYYVLQQMNEYMFPNIDFLMHNVTILSKQILNTCERVNLEKNDVKQYFMTKDNKPYITIKNMKYRLCNFIDDSIAYERPLSFNMMKEAGRVVGNFNKQLEDLSANLMQDSAPEMHKTPLIYKRFYNTIKQNHLKNNKEVTSIAKRFIKYKKYAYIISDKIEDGTIPLRVAHNDTKFNNILFRNSTGEGLTLIDFDNTMPGSWLFDFGDAIRYACNMSENAEEEQDMDKVKFNMDYYKAFTKGYLKAVGKCLKDEEIKLLPYSPLVIAYELGLRFFTDYMIGNRLFPVASGQSNLKRAEVQLVLFERMLENLDEIKEYTYELAKNNF